MAEKSIGAVEAQRDLARLLRTVSGKGDRYVVEESGEAIAAVVPIELYRRWKEDRDAFFEEIERVSRRSDLSPVEADALAEEAVANVRHGGFAAG
jgi:prevent-host-death family protein